MHSHLYVKHNGQQQYIMELFQMWSSKFKLFQVSRLRYRLIFFYIIIHIIVAVPTSNLLIPSDSRTNTATHTFKHIQTSKDSYKYSFFPHNTITQCNKLPMQYIRRSAYDLRQQMNARILREEELWLIIDNDERCCWAHY